MDVKMHEVGTNETSKTLVAGSLEKSENHEKTDELDDQEPIVVLDDVDLPIVLLVDHDHIAERATFTIDQLTYVVEVPHDDQTTRLSVVARYNGLVYSEVLDLAVLAAGKRFAGNAALRFGLSAVVIAGHLPLLLEEVQKLRAEADGADDSNEPVVEPTGVDRDTALERLRSGDLLDGVVADLTTLGWVGEENAKRLLVLTALSRKLPAPLWALRLVDSLVSEGNQLNYFAEITPPEDLVHVSRLTNAALSYQDSNALRHKLLLIDDTATLTKEVALALRILQKRGALSQSIVPRHNLSGSSRALITEIRGPLAVIAATSAQQHKKLGFNCCHIPADTSAEHVQKVRASERAWYAKPIRQKDHARKSIIAQLHNLQRLLYRYPVVIPFAERIHFPDELLRQPGVQTRFLGVIAASALLHQYQRLRDDGHIIADERDFQNALDLSPLLCAGEPSTLGGPATTLLTAVRQAGLTTFTKTNVYSLLPHWSYASFRSAVTDLLQNECITKEQTGRGVLQTYHVVATEPSAAPHVTLLTETSLRSEVG
jgi:hypothetical protein